MLLKNILLDKLIKLVSNNPEAHLNNSKLEEIRYGLEAIYLTISKLIVILISSWLLGIIKEVIIFTILYNFIRLFAFGIHASKSYICLIYSLIIFLFLPFISTLINLNKYCVIAAGLFCILMMMIYAPADTYKRPLVNNKKRFIYKILSVLVSVLYLIIALIINNPFITNCLILSILIETIMILPITYRLFKLTYNNYRLYDNGLKA